MSQPVYRQPPLISLFTLTILLIGFTASVSAQSINSTPVVTVSAASYSRTVAPESIAAAFGTQLATTTTTVVDTDPNTPGIQLPDSPGGTTVRIGGTLARLLFVSPTQINFVMPADLNSLPAANPPGYKQVEVEVISGDQIVSKGFVQVTQIAPALFYVDADGKMRQWLMRCALVPMARRIMEPWCSGMKEQTLRDSIRWRSALKTRKSFSFCF